MSTLMFSKYYNDIMLLKVMVYDRYVDFYKFHS